MHKRQDLLTLDKHADIENEIVTKLICPINLTLIENIPVKINERFYDYDCFYDHLLKQRLLMQEASRRGNTCTPRCPFNIKLPILLQVAIEEGENSIRHALNHFFEESAEEYEDQIAIFSRSLLNDTASPNSVAENITSSSPLFRKPLEIRSHDKHLKMTRNGYCNPCCFFF